MLTGEGESRNSEFGIPTSKFHCVIAGGGTGGHLFPGIAVAKELDNRFENAEILFVIGRERKESNILSNYGYQARSIDVEGLKGRGWKKVVSVLFKLPKSIWQSASVINEFSPDLVLGMGGYSSGPMCLAAKFLGIPTAIHEQNSYPGLTNRLLSRLVDRVFISLEESRMHFRGGSVFLTGNPVREELFSDRRVERKEGDRFTILVVGGSQGARAGTSRGGHNRRGEPGRQTKSGNGLVHRVRHALDLVRPYSGERNLSSCRSRNRRADRRPRRRPEHGDDGGGDFCRGRRCLHS